MDKSFHNTKYMYIYFLCTYLHIHLQMNMQFYIFKSILKKKRALKNPNKLDMQFYIFKSILIKKKKALKNPNKLGSVFFKGMWMAWHHTMTKVKLSRLVIIQTLFPNEAVTKQTSHWPPHVYYRTCNL